ncbi:MFS transporter [Streptomyces diastatochromogenes]|uniref:MFS transporter n=1 Tax=Streptomyces diastatochromogenes TaxID=42236 RepID=A0A233S6M3_STRDA|nr:MFS transporter [Streptomyces diastatochromogenes]OXY91273.1 MFS transporter [Streptomyces diastatochromogenes]
MSSSLTSAPHSGSPARHKSAGVALAAALLGFFVMTLDALIVNVALPEIGRGFGAGIAGLQWVVDGYTLMFAALLLSAGSITDRVGARTAFGAGLAVFVAASAACGFAPNLGTLVAARLVQGAGAAVIVPASLALLREAYEDQAQRARAISVWAMGGSVGAAAGPVAGGLLSLVSWRMIFFVNLPVGLLALFLLTRTTRSPRRAEASFDWAGQCAAVAAMGGLTYAAIEAGADGFGAPRVLVAFAVAVVAGSVFLLAQARGKHPMVPMALLRSRTMAVSAGVGFALNIGFYGMVFLLSLYLQQTRALSPLATGMAFLPMTLLTAFVSPTAAWFAARFGQRMPVIAGQLVMAAGLVLLCLAPASAPTWLLVLLMIPVGAGGSLAVPAVTAMLLDRVPAERAGTAGGVLNASRQVGGALAVAVFGALVARQAGFFHGLRTSLLIAALLVLATTATSLLLRPAAALDALTKEPRA